MVDYVQIVKGKKSNNRTNEVDQISRDLLALAKEFDCPVLVLSQLSRDIEKRPDKTPLNSDLRESGQLEQDAEEIIFIHNEQEEGKTKPNDGLAKLIVSKCRNGRKGTVITEFQGEFSRFVNTNRNWASKNNDSKPLAEKFGR
jgi:replicative DNA helicase